MPELYSAEDLTGSTFVILVPRKEQCEGATKILNIKRGHSAGANNESIFRVYEVFFAASVMSIIGAR
jgi:hypothetical protein